MAEAPDDIPLNDWRKQRFLDWLCTPPSEREPTHKTKLAAELDVDSSTLRNWQNSTAFLREWERRYLQTIGSPGRKLTIMDTLYEAAKDIENPKHVQAAKEYFVIEGSLKPQRVEVAVSRDASELTDDQIAAMIAAHAQSEAERRAEETTVE